MRKVVKLTKEQVADAQSNGGLGDLIANVTKKLGIPTCAGCEKRRQALNKVRLPVFVRVAR